MAIPKNPIDLTHIDYEVYEVEARVESILSKWLRFYFSGVPFTTVDADGADVVRTYDLCEVLFNQGRAILQPKPDTLIHFQVADNRGEGCVSGNKTLVRDSFVWNVFVKTSGNKGNRRTEYENRRVASQLKQLMSGCEVQSLVAVGVQRLNVRRGPLPVASRDSFIRQFIVEVEGAYAEGRNVG